MVLLFITLPHLNPIATRITYNIIIVSLKNIKIKNIKKKTKTCACEIMLIFNYLLAILYR